ncbi:MAG: hypothetical protein OXH57_11780 [Ekhidna sp.]|nr:hypothetical protein [Ekhidna sp.]
MKLKPSQRYERLRNKLRSERIFLPQRAQSLARSTQRRCDSKTQPLPLDLLARITNYT